jgi:hypothetical protein
MTIAETVIKALDSAEFLEDGEYTIHVFEDGSGMYEKRSNDWYPLSVEQVAKIRAEWEAVNGTN